MGGLAQGFSGDQAGDRIDIGEHHFRPAHARGRRGGQEGDGRDDAGVCRPHVEGRQGQVQGAGAAGSRHAGLGPDLGRERRLEGRHLGPLGQMRAGQDLNYSGDIVGLDQMAPVRKWAAHGQKSRLS
jgi:hypothetical protein